MSINRESNLLNQKIVYDITKFTTLDYANHLSCIVWFVKCNMRCLYCYNNDLVFAKNGNYSINDLLEFLKSRVGLLDAVVLSGAEATLQDLNKICKEIKKLGFKIKLDTNGIKNELIQELIEDNLIDFISLDYKAPKYSFEKITNSCKYDDFEKSLKYLIEKEFDFEVRTTIHSDLLSIDDLNYMIDYLNDLGYKNSYFLQEFLDTGSNIGGIQKSLNSFEKDKIIDNKLTIVYRN